MNVVVTETSKIPADKAIAFAAEYLKTDPASLSVTSVTGGYSLNRRAIVSAGDSHLFVKEVDETLVDGDGERERSWLTKDQAVANALRSKGISSVAEWSKLSVDREVLLLPAYRAEDGWLWEVPDDKSVQPNYIDAVLALERSLEGLSFSEQEVFTLSLQPYFREKIAEDELLPVLDDANNVAQLQRRCSELLSKPQNERVEQSLHHMISFLDDSAKQGAVRQIAQQLRSQPDEVFGHCDLRSDNLAYHPDSQQVRLIDWNWASFTPKGFGSVEFLIDCERHGVDVSPWVGGCNWPLMASLVGLFLRSSLQPNLGDSSRLRDNQLISASIAAALLKTNNHL